MNNCSYVEEFTIPDKNKPKKSKTMTISHVVIVSRNHHETTLLGSEEPTQVSLFPLKEPIKESTEEPYDKITLLGSEEPTQVFLCPPNNLPKNLLKNLLRFPPL